MREQVLTKNWGNNSRKLFFPTLHGSYSPDEKSKEKPPVTIRLVLQTERLIHGGSEGRGTIDWKDIHIRWEGNDTAVVET